MGKINGRGCHTSADAKDKEESRHCIGNQTSSSNTKPCSNPLLCKVVGGGVKRTSANRRYHLETPEDLWEYIWEPTVCLIVRTVKMIMPRVRLCVKWM